MRKEEEGLKQYYEFVDLGKHEKSTVNSSITQAVSESFSITETKLYHQLQKKNVENQLRKAQLERIKRVKEYIGPKSGRPKTMSSWEIYNSRKSIEIELKQKFIYMVLEILNSTVFLFKSYILGC
jgi:hypothetical protein